MHNANGLDQRSGFFPFKDFHLCGVSAGSAVVLGYGWQLVGSCTVNNVLGRGKGNV